MTGQPTRLGDSLAGAGKTVEERIAALAALPTRHATDPEPSGRIRDVDAWSEAQWRRAVPARFHGARLEQVAALHGAEVADPLGLWVDLKCDRPNVLVFGPVGTGKTFTAIATVRPLHERGHTIAVWPVTSFLEATSPGSSRSEEAMASAIDSDVLVFDDLGMERGTEWVAERVYEVVNRRWLDGLPSIVTTNVDAEEMPAAVGERVWSRLVDGSPVALHLGGDDLRRRAQ